MSFKKKNDCPYNNLFSNVKQCFKKKRTTARKKAHLKDNCICFPGHEIYSNFNYYHLSLPITQNTHTHTLAEWSVTACILVQDVY